LFQLAEVFAIDICAYAIMHNHLHLVLHVDVERIKSLTTSEVLERWHQLFKGNIVKNMKYTIL
jgi:hypothetical protein